MREQIPPYNSAKVPSGASRKENRFRKKPRGRAAAGRSRPRVGSAYLAKTSFAVCDFTWAAALAWTTPPRAARSTAET
jgi:hypothetical protein